MGESFLKEPKKCYLQPLPLPIPLLSANTTTTHRPHQTTPPGIRDKMLTSRASKFQPEGPQRPATPGGAPRGKVARGGLAPSLTSGSAPQPPAENLQA